MHTGRKFSVAASVLLLHAGALWAFQSGLVRRAVEAVAHDEVVVELIAPEPPAQVAIAPEIPPPPPKPVPVARRPPAPAPAPAPVPVARRQPTPPAPPAAPAPMPLAIADPTPAPAAPSGVAPAPVPAPLPPVAAPVQVAVAPPATPKPALTTLPSSDAEYLQNPKPEYPALSRRKREQGTVVVRVFIGADGSAQKAEIGASSGFARLDATALDTAQRWRYVPGKQGGVPVAMWFNVPIHFSLE